MIGFAHRGARAHARENTLEAFALALRLGAAGLESDAWVTADGMAVLDHDGVVSRRWRRTPISTVVRAALPHHIPALDELFAQFGHDFELSLDIKDPSAFDAVLTSVRAAHAEDRLWACHRSLRILAAWREGAPNVRLVHSTGRDQLQDGIAAGAAAARAAGVDAVNLRVREWSEQAVAEVHAHDVKAFGWDAHTDQALARAVSLGLDGVYSDHVDRMMEAIRSVERGQDER